MADPETSKRSLWPKLGLSLLMAVVVWQGVQAIAIGAVGVPGLYLYNFGQPAGDAARQRRAAREPALGDPWRTTIQDRELEKPKAAPAPESAVAIPSDADLASWIRAQAREFVGGVDAEGNMLYRFDIWLDMPAALAHKPVSVAYVFDAPSAQPGSQSSNDAKTGFRVKFGGAACAESVTVTATFGDGGKREARVDGCKILN